MLSMLYKDERVTDPQAVPQFPFMEKMLMERLIAPCALSLLCDIGPVVYDHYPKHVLMRSTPMSGPLCLLLLADLRAALSYT